MTSRILSGRYRIVRLVGKGGMANVYLAIDLKTNHQVAIKVLRPEFNQDEEFLKRFEREAQAASQVSHHNIVNLLDVGTEDTIRYLVMEYVEGTNLKELIKEKGKIPPAIAVQITIRILSALQHTHRNGVIHRDIKPQNIMVQSQGHIKVADFGIARVANSATLSKGDSVMGSVHYFSPEQAAGDEVLQTGDIYSVGVVLYEMLTGRVPFEGDSPVAVAMQHLHNKPRPIQEFSPNVSPAISAVVMKAMEKNPKDRYQHAIEMATDLKAALETKNPEVGQAFGEDSDKLSKVLAKEEKAIRRRRTRGKNETDRALLKTGERRKLKKRNRWQIVLALVGIALTLTALIGGGSYIYRDFILTTQVPNLLGESDEAVLALLNKAQLKGGKQEISNDVIPAGKVIMQNPEYGERIKKGEMVLYYVSTGKDEILVPDLAHITRESATAMVSSMGMVLEIADRVISDEKVDMILDQSPAANTKAQSGQVIQVVLSGGRASMPDVRGGTLEQAKVALNSYNLAQVKIKGVEVTKNRPHGMIIDQSPLPDTQTTLRVPIELTIASSRWQPYQGPVAYKLPPVTQEATVRVTLLIDGGQEILQWERAQKPGGDLHLMGVIYHNQGGNYAYKIYQNDTLLTEEKITLTGEKEGEQSDTGSNN